MTSDVPTPNPAERRRFAKLLLGLGTGLAVLVLALTLITQQWWMLAFLVLLTPNLVIGLRELRASRN